MSTLPENELDLDKLFLPAWAQEPASAKHYANFEAAPERPDRGDRRGGRRPGGRRPEFGGQPRGGSRPPGDGRGPRRPGGPGGPGAGPRQGDRRRPGGPRGDDRRPRPEAPPAPPPEVNVAFIPDEKGVESLARQIKTTGRAYPLFDIARLILQKPERYALTFSVKKKADGSVAQPLFVCALDDTLWLSQDEAVAHVMRNHFATFYQAEKTPTEPPKGTYTFVAQCGMSGVILGPPNHHDYQNQLHKLHTARFSRMPFDMFKSRVKIVRDEAVVKKWLEDQSFKTEFLCLNMPEPLRLPSIEAVEKHFREVHADNIVKPVESHTVSGAGARNFRSPGLSRLVRQLTEDQRRFPLQLATSLSQQFASQGLQFFKVNKAITHVSVARPHYLDMTVTPVSDGVSRIVDFINATTKCTRRKLIEALAPTPAPAPIPVAPPAEPAPVATAQTGETAAPAATPAPAQPAGPTPEQTAVISDLHWLIHQGHVIEFANGIMETAKKPLPRPPKPEKAAPAAAAPSIEPAAAGAVPDLSSEQAAPTVEIPPAAEAPAEPETPAAEAAPEAPPSAEQPAS